jgi:uncharacterized damage-inducible protein DinB
LRADQARHLFDYNYWADARILDAARAIPQDALARPLGLSYGGVFGTLVHTLAAEWVWHSRFARGESPAKSLTPDQFPDLKALRARWAKEEMAMRSYLKALDDARLDAAFTYRTTDGKSYSTPLWQALLHLLNHGTQHRSEAAAEITRMGSSPGDIDYMVYIRTVPEFDISHIRTAGE